MWADCREGNACPSTSPSPRRGSSRRSPLEVILGQNLKCGCYDGSLRLGPGVLDAAELTAYDESAIARGFSVQRRQGEKEKVVIRPLTPTSNAELDEVFAAVKRIADHWRCDIEIDCNPINASVLDAALAESKAFNAHALKGMMDDIVTGESNDLTLFSAFYPLIVGKQEAEAFGGDVEAFARWMHEKQ